MNRFTVGLSGLAEADVGCVRDALQRSDLSGWQLGESADADVLIIDIDSVWGHMDWLKAIASGRPTVAYSDQPPTKLSGATLIKPLQPEALAQLLARLADELPDHAAAAAATEDPPTTVEPLAAPAEETPATAADSGDSQPHVPAITPAAAEEPVPVQAPEDEPEPQTVGAWLLAGRAREPFAIAGPGGERLLVDPGKGVYHGPALLKPLVPLVQLPPDVIEPPDMGELATLAAAGQPLSRLLWLAALVGTPGRIAGDADASTAFRLERWPQIEREFPRHFRIATAMMKQPGSLGELASSANTPEADVADFINAYTAIGFIAREHADDARAGERRPLLRNPFARNASR